MISLSIFIMLKIDQGAAVEPALNSITKTLIFDLSLS